MDVSELPEDDLRTLLCILQKDHPEALEAAIDTLNNSEDNSLNDITFTRIQEQPANVPNDVSAKYKNLRTEKGCYMYYDPSSAKLKLLYTSTPISKAIGFYSSPTIPDFKYKKNFGRADLIGNCASGIAGRKQYYSGWCQFIRAARSAIAAEEKNGEIVGELWIFDREDDQQGLDVDLYAYDALASYQTVLLPANTSLQQEILGADAVTCLPKHSSIFEEVKQMELNRWLVRANNVGATSRFVEAAASTLDNSSFENPHTLVSLIDDPGNKSPKSVTQPEEELGEIPPPPHADFSVKGCYLLYDADSAKLKLQYSTKPVRNAIAFYCAGEGYKIRGFKFTKNFGRADLIGNCASGVTGRKNYYSGLCQFIRAAKALNGPVWIYPHREDQPGLDVDIYVYYMEPEEQKEMGLDLDGHNSIKLEEGVQCNINHIDGVACLPKKADFFSELKTMDMNRWMTEGNTMGATSRFEYSVNDSMP